MYHQTVNVRLRFLHILRNMYTCICSFNHSSSISPCTISSHILKNYIESFSKLATQDDHKQNSAFTLSAVIYIYMCTYIHTYPNFSWNGFSLYVMIANGVSLLAVCSIELFELEKMHVCSHMYHKTCRYVEDVTL